MDTLSTSDMSLNVKAKTKRQILKSLAENFDPYGYNLPVLNRARLFLHQLQLDRNLNWDTELNSSKLHEWKLIANQVNSSKPLSLPRYVGNMSGKYNLIAFTDSSKDIFEVTIYLHNLDNNTINFVMARNRIVTKQLSSKSIPTLEFNAIALGVEFLMETYKELMGSESVEKINICNLHVYTDSYVALNWLKQYVELDKMRNLSVFTLNRLQKIAKLCETKSVVFKFVNGSQNPADFTTRPISAKLLAKSNFLSGPEFLTKKESEIPERQDLLEVQIPNPKARIGDGYALATACTSSEKLEREKKVDFYLQLLQKFSSYQALHNRFYNLFRFINRFKARVKRKNPERFHYLECIDNDDLEQFTTTYLYKCDQWNNYKDVFDYFDNPSPNKKDIPHVINQLNLFIDGKGLLRVGSKFVSNRNYSNNYTPPVLLSRKSRFAELTIIHFHNQLFHANRLTVISEIRKKLWIPSCYSLVKSITRRCVFCQRHNNRTIKVNQNKYRNFRAEHPCVPFQYIFVDHMGPYYIKSDNPKSEPVKVYGLVICCLWSRAINVEYCYDLSADAFLKALQMHIFNNGLSELCLSDMGSQIVAGSNKIKAYILNDSETHKFFNFNNIQSPEFEQYFKGKKELGGLVEICVKLSKNLISGAIGNLILSSYDFLFTLRQSVNIINRRPIAFREKLTSNDIDLPDVITPEQLIYGRTLTSMNIIPEMHPIDETNLEVLDSNIPTSFDKLNKMRNRLIKIYNEEFVQDLVRQATNETNRYRPKLHHKLKVGDIVFIKDPLLKPLKYPLGKVLEAFENELNEVTQVKILKGNSGEIVKRHVESLIPLFTDDQMQAKDKTNQDEVSNIENS